MPTKTIASKAIASKAALMPRELRTELIGLMRFVVVISNAHLGMG